MNIISNWLEEKAFWVKTGTGLRIVNDGKAVDELVIRYKEFYFSIMLDEETGKPTGDFTWSTDYGMFPTTPVRDHYKAVRVGRSATSGEHSTSNKASPTKIRKEL